MFCKVFCVYYADRHDLQNVFWRILLTDIHRALSFDRMHVHHGGLWRHHLWKELQFWILELGREAVAEIDAKYVYIII
jgi:hypothetical protein